MTKSQLLQLLKTKKPSEIDLTGVDLEGIKSNLRNVDKNEIIFRSGDKANSIYFVIQGEIILTKGDEIKSVSAKEYFGLEAISENTKRSQKAISVKPSIVLEIVLNERSSDTIPTAVGQLSANQFLNTPSKKVEMSNEGESEQAHRDYVKESIGDVLYIKVKVKKAILTNSKSFLNFMNKSIASNYKKHIVDLTYCEIIDSTFLGVLVKTLKSVAAKGGEIVLIYDQSQSSTLFMITYMDKVFRIFNNKEEALNYFKGK